MIYIYKLIFVAVFAFIGYHHPPFLGTTQQMGAVIGAATALALVILALRVRVTELKYIWSSSIGMLLGILVGLGLYALTESISLFFSAKVFFQMVFLFGFPITGLFIGLQKPNMFSPLNIKEFLRGSSAFTDSFLLDTSAIIDGRIVPIAASGFISGELIITQFVLAELQSIADSSDPSKKIRGKRGLDVIDQLRKTPEISVTILNKSVSGVKEVDQKLVLLARESNFKVITNDVNLSKIAKLQDVSILNINELAFSLKPIVYPGEHLTVNILKEGKEKRQGIAYLEDGTMVVVDDAKSDIGKTLRIEVTSVLQSTTGKMIFGKKS
ncbi:MAG TPA: TRAM domain-containing protein [Candidatus Aminicenantes bacterium]|nr:TRAM domain-containing protein [Candidatus Aminicenantes bacterium]